MTALDTLTGVAVHSDAASTEGNVFDLTSVPRRRRLVAGDARQADLAEAKGTSSYNGNELGQ